MQMTMRVQESSMCIPTCVHTRARTRRRPHVDEPVNNTHIASQSSCLVLIGDTGAFTEQRELPNESVMSADEEDDPWSSVMENPKRA